MGGQRTIPLNSWDKSYFEGGVFGIGAPKKTTKNTMVPDEDNREKESSHVNWNILRPIMAYCNEPSTLKVKSYKSPGKALWAT